MVIEFKYGKLIVTQHELVVRLEGEHRVTLQATADAVQLMGNGANVVVANGSETKWSIRLDSDDQLREIAAMLGCAII